MVLPLEAVMVAVAQEIRPTVAYQQQAGHLNLVPQKALLGHVLQTVNMVLADRVV